MPRNVQTEDPQDFFKVGVERVVGWGVPALPFVCCVHSGGHHVCVQPRVSAKPQNSCYSHMYIRFGFFSWAV